MSPSAVTRLFVGLGAVRTGIEWAVWLGLLIWWIDVLALSPFELILTAVVLEVAVLTSETPTGVIADLYSRKWSMVLGLCLIGVSFFWSVASTNFWVILPAQALYGFGWTFTSGADIAWFTDELKGAQPENADTDNAIEVALLHRHGWGIAGGIVCVPLMMWFGRESVRGAIAAAGVLTILVAFGWALGAAERHFTPQRHRETFLGTLRKGVAVVRERPRLRRLVTVVLCIALPSVVIDRLGWARFIQSIDTGADSITLTGVLFLIAAITGLFVNWIVTRHIRHRGGTNGTNSNPLVVTVVVLLVLSAVGSLLIALGAGVAIIGIGLAAQDGTREAVYPVMDAWANRETPSEVRATVHSLMGQAGATSEAAGGLLFGLIAELAGVPASLTIAACLLLLGASFALPTLRD